MTSIDDNITIESSAEPAAPPPPRRRGRPPKSASVPPADEWVTVEVSDQPTVESKPKRTRRSKKLSGSDVSQIITMISHVGVMMTGQEHWYIPPDETKPFAGEMAEIVNRIPTKYISAFASMNSYIVVSIGCYSVIRPRIETQRQINHAARAQRLRTAEGTPDVVATNNAHEPWRS